MRPGQNVPFLKPSGLITSPLLGHPPFATLALAQAADLVLVGGGKRIRTADFLRAKQALYQLSYAPVGEVHSKVVVGLGGLEPPTSRLSSARSTD